jgi:diguanylate cyclase (GGDEF)-like protein/PAS domain S-box-containing protein
MSAQRTQTVTYTDASDQVKTLVLACAVFLIACGLIVMLGWLSQMRALLLALPNSGFTTFNSAVLFVLCGTWVVLTVARPDRYRSIRRFIAGVVICLSGSVIVEHLGDVNFGIDLLSLHRWVQSDNPMLGRLAPNTAASFLIAGALLVLFDLRGGAYRESAFLTFLRITLALVAGTGLLGYILQLEWLYKWFVHNRMGLNTAIAMTVLATTLFLATQPRLQLDDARRISVFASGLLTLVAAVAALTGFAVFKQGMQTSLASNIQSVADSRTEFLLANIKQGQRSSQAIANYSTLKELSAEWAAGKSISNQLGYDLRDAALALGLGFIQVRSNRGVPIAQVGVASEEAELDLPIRTQEGSTSLIWNGGAVLRVTLPLKSGSRVVGSIVTEQALPEVAQVFRYTDSMGETGEIKLCGRNDDELECFPSRLVPKVHRVPFFKNGNPSFPVARAILGESGQLDIVDFRGVRVFASYRPVGDTGLGLVAKMDGDEIYRPVQTQGLWLLSLPLLLLALTAYFVHRHVRPIAQRLQSSEAAARDYATDVTESMLKLEAARSQLAQAEVRSRTIVESAFDAYIAMDINGMVVNWNEAATRILGYTRDEVMGTKLSSLVIPERFREAHEQGMRHYRATGVGSVLGRRVELPARHKDGHEIPVEMTITVVDVDEEQWFSCFLHDISERKKASAEIEIREHLLRSLTDALPVLVAHIDREERYQYCNNTYFDMYGVRPEAVVGRTVRDFLGEANYAAIKPFIDEAFNGAICHFEQAMMAKDEMRYVEGRLIPQQDTAGKISGLYMTVWDITQIRRRELRLADKASKDALTGLLNRAAIMEILETEIQEHYTRRDGLALLFLDADKFKQVNDTLGHAAGDEVLRTFARRLTETVRGTDFVARLGGDEFVVLLTAVDSSQTAALVAAKIIAAINEPMLLNEEVRTVSTSIGIAYIANQSMSAEALLAEADAALYEAKREGRNIYRMHDLASRRGYRSDLEI